MFCAIGFYQNKSLKSIRSPGFLGNSSHRVEDGELFSVFSGAWLMLIQVCNGRVPVIIILSIHSNTFINK